MKKKKRIGEKRANARLTERKQQKRIKFWLFSDQNCSFKTYIICISIFRSGSRVAIDRFMGRSSEMYELYIISKNYLSSEWCSVYLEETSGTWKKPKWSISLVLSYLLIKSC